MTDHFSENLRFLCAERPSTAQVCRDIGINQQQFSKYLSGRAKPSPHNLRRIARYFAVEENLLLGPHEQLVADFKNSFPGASRVLTNPVMDSFPGDLQSLRQYTGAYQVYFQAPVDPDGVVVNAVFLDEHNREVRSRLIEALPASHTTARRWTRCDGRVCFHNGRLYVVDCERNTEQSLSMYILSHPPRQQRKYLFGSMCFLASLPRRMPHASKVVWKKFDTYKSIRELFESCGVYPLNSKQVDPRIREYLTSERPPSQ